MAGLFGSPFLMSDRLEYVSSINASDDTREGGASYYVGAPFKAALGVGLELWIVSALMSNAPVQCSALTRGVCSKRCGYLAPHDSLWISSGLKRFTASKVPSGQPTGTREKGMMFSGMPRSLRKPSMRSFSG